MAVKKEGDRAKVVSSSFKSFMALPAGKGDLASTLGKEVAEGLGELKKGEEERGQQEAQTLQQQQKQIQATQQKEQILQQEESIVQKTLVGDLKRRIKKMRSTIPAPWKWWLCLVVALVYDIVDVIVMIFTGFASETGEWVVDIGMQFFFMFMLGKYYSKTALVEFIPILDIVPIYTYSVWKSRARMKAATGEIKELKKEEKELEGGMGPAKRGVSTRGIITLIILGLIVAGIGFFVLGLIGAIAGPAILAFIILLMNETTRPVALGGGLIALVGGGLVLGAAPFMSGFGGPVGEAMSIIASTPERLNNYWTTNNPVDRIKAYAKKQAYIATGDFYTGKVDENAEVQLGVYLEDLKQADPTFYTNRPVIIFSTLKVFTLDKPIDITLGCKSSRIKPGTTPAVYPTAETFTVDTFEETDVDCNFPTESIPEGTTTLTLSADFNFKTLSYIKSYFMDAERLRSLRREGIDPLDQYGIRDKNPVAIHTVGPVGIGMGIGKPPSGIDQDLPQEIFTLGITIDNKWEGKITKMNRMVLIIPKEFVLLDIGADFTAVDCGALPPEEQEICNNDLNRVYEIKDPTFVVIGRGQFKSYRGHLKVEQPDYGKLLGITPVITKYFKTTIEYSYKLEKQRLVDVKPATRRGLITGGADIVAPVITAEWPPAKTGNNSVTVSWTTDKPTIDVLQYWDVTRAPPTYPASTTPNEANYSTTHSRTLSGLSTGKSYGVKILSLAENGLQSDKTQTFQMN